MTSERNGGRILWIGPQSCATSSGSRPSRFARLERWAAQGLTAAVFPANAAAMTSLIGSRSALTDEPSVIVTPPDWAVMGIGLNVSIPPEEFPAELRETATSIGGDVAVDEALEAACGALMS